MNMKKKLYTSPDIQVSAVQAISLICYSIQIGTSGTDEIDTGGGDLIGN